MGYLIGIDIGSQGIKGVLLDENLKVIKKVYLEHDILQPKPNWFEHDALKTWWGGFKIIIKKLLENNRATKIIGLGCSGVSPCLLPLDRQDQPLRNAILYGIDTRSIREIQEMTKLLGEKKVLELNKQPLSTQSVGPKILWYMKNEPDNFSKTVKIFTLSNYITYKLTGNYVLDHSQASQFAPFYNFNNRDWDSDVIALFNVPFTLFPELKYPYEIAGYITKDAAIETGLPEGLPVVVSTADGFTEVISTGGFNQAEVSLIYGSTGLIALTSKKMSIMKEMFIIPHPLFQDHYLIYGGMATTAALTKWFRDNFAELEKIRAEKININAYELLEKQAEKIKPGSEGLLILPYFSGERTPIKDPLARGVIMGLTTYHKKGHIYRALLESTAYGFRHHLDILANYGFNINKLIACGGGTRSKLWVQIVSDVTGYDQFLPDLPLGSEIGSAYLAAIASGLLEDFSKIKEVIHENSQRKVRFNRDSFAIYQDYYQIYRNLYKNIKDEMHKLASL